MTGLSLVVVGDLLLDRDVDGTVERVSPDAPAPVLDVAAVRQSAGGAGLAALLAAADRAHVTLAAPLARDEAGRWLAQRLRPHLDLVPLGHAGPTRRKTRVRSGSHTLVRVDDGGPGTPARVPVAALRACLAEADAVLVADYGGGVTLDREVRALLDEVVGRVPVVWDPHPRGGRPVAGVGLATPNVAEGRGALGDDGPPERLAVRLRDVWRARAVAVTAGSVGAFLADGGLPRYVPAPAIPADDTCGAGDRFAATAALALAAGAVPPEAVERAVADASAWVAAGGADGFHRRADGAPRPRLPVGGLGLEHLAARLRGGGRRLVATAGRFDAVGAGDVAALQAARRLGDALVVLLDPDVPVRALTGPPAVPAPDRARVLRALGCVDAVVELDGPDLRAAVARLRPDVWVAGHRGAGPAEREAVEAFGGRVVVLSGSDGRPPSETPERAAAAREQTMEAVG